MTASGMVPSTIVGRIRWLSADRKAPGLPGEQAVDQHEAGDRREEEQQRDAAGDRRPAEMPEKKMISSRPHQKIGIE